MESSTRPLWITGPPYGKQGQHEGLMFRLTEARRAMRLDTFGRRGARTKRRERAVSRRSAMEVQLGIADIGCGYELRSILIKRLVWGLRAQIALHGRSLIER